MKVFLRIYTFQGDYAHGGILFEDNTILPFSMPISAYEQALEKGLLIYNPAPTRDGAYSESPLLYFEQQ